jgi:tetratricopeptide (TPR) repeat protein
MAYLFKPARRSHTFRRHKILSVLGVLFLLLWRGAPDAYAEGHCLACGYCDESGCPKAGCTGSCNCTSGSSSSGSSSRAPSHSGLSAPGALALQAYYAFQRHDYAAAIRYCEEGLRISGDFAFQQSIPLYKGYLAESKGDWKSALRYYREANRLRSSDVLRLKIQQAEAALTRQISSRTTKTSADDLDTLKADSELRERDVHGFHFVKSKQLPPPPILKGDLPSDPVKRAAVKGKLDDYMKSWKVSNQEYQKAAPEKAAQIKKKMEIKNTEFKARLKRDYAVNF